MKACVVQELTGPSGLVYTDVDGLDGGDDTMVIDKNSAAAIGAHRYRAVQALPNVVVDPAVDNSECGVSGL